MISPPTTLEGATLSAMTEQERVPPHNLEEEVVALFDQFRDRLLRYLLTFGLSVQDGEEIIQEVFLALYRHLAANKPRQHLQGWLFRVAHNLALKRREHLRRSREVVSEMEIMEDHAADPNPTPEEQMVQHQTQERLRGVLAALSEQDSRCLALRAEGLRYRDIASVLNMSLGAVSESLARSLARLARVAER
jgi:RNA polymerase sigma-70 factor, ECF subfamily